MSVADRVNIFQELADVLPFGVALVAVDGTILYWNRAAERIRGYRSHEIVGRRCGSDSLEHCEQVSATPARSHGTCADGSCPHALVLRQDQPLDEPVLVSHRDGHRFPVRMFAFPMHDERGEVVAVAEVFVERSRDEVGRGWAEANCSSPHPAIGNLPVRTETEEELRRQLLDCSGKTGVFLIGVEGLDETVKRYGAGIRAVALRALAQTLVCVLGPAYFIGCWSEDRFLAMVPECDEDTCVTVLKRLDRASRACAVTWWGDRITIQVRATGTLADSEDSIATVMERLEADPAQAAGGEQ